MKDELGKTIDLLIKSLCQYGAFSALSYILLSDIRSALALGYMISIFFWKLEDVEKHLLKNVKNNPDKQKLFESEKNF